MASTVEIHSMDVNVRCIGQVVKDQREITEEIGINFQFSSRCKIILSGLPLPLLLLHILLAFMSFVPFFGSARN